MIPNNIIQCSKTLNYIIYAIPYINYYYNAQYYKTLKYNTIQVNTIWKNTIQNNAVQQNKAVWNDILLSGTIQTTQCTTIWFKK